MQQMEPENIGLARQDPGYYPMYQGYEDQHAKLQEPLSHSTQEEDFSEEFIDNLAKALSKRLSQSTSQKGKKEKLSTPQRLGLAFVSLFLVVITAIVLFLLFGANTVTLIALVVICITFVIINEQYS